MLTRFARKSMHEKAASLAATCQSFVGLRNSHDPEQRRKGLLTGKYAPPRVFEANEEFYLSYRPDSDVFFKQYPELEALSQKWVEGNVINNAGDLARLYGLVFNINQILHDCVPGDMAELGVFRGNSAAVLAHYARVTSKAVWLFDTFAGFDERDLIDNDKSRRVEFSNTSLQRVRQFVGSENVKFVQGYFPDSIPTEIRDATFCLVHIDCDLYQPAKEGMNFFYPRLSPGGLLILHDYSNPAFPGIRRATDELCRRIAEKPVVLGDKSGTAMIRKSGALG